MRSIKLVMLILLVITVWTPVVLILVSAANKQGTQVQPVRDIPKSIPATTTNQGVSVMLYFGSMMLLILTLILGGILLKIQQKGLHARLAKEKAEKEKNLAEFQEKVAITALNALRSQMNPHFIFNCLNSIKLYAAENNAEAASDYLSKFARLMRLVLENSDTDSLLLVTELETLELYIQLEIMRFKERLQYTLIVDDNVDLHYIEIPPLLIQPYIENAIWHGIMQKKDAGLIFIHLSYQEADAMLTVVIKDDGIGREKAAELKTKSAMAVKSYGMTITSERIKLINQLQNILINVEVKDLYDENSHQATGTMVILKIPIK